MRHFIFGVLLDSVITGTMVGAGNLYDSRGNVQAPRGSQQQYDYFRQRQQFLDIGQMRKQADKEESDRQLGRKPCL